MVPVLPYNVDMVLDVVVDNLRQRGRGAQTRLAEAVGVKVQTVNKWSKRQTCPEPDKWEAIEDHFGLERGTLRRASGLDERPTSLGTDERLTHLEKQLARIEALLMERRGRR